MAGKPASSNPKGRRSSRTTHSIEAAISPQILALARHSIEAHHFPRIARCLEILPEKEIWWRPNEASNSVGNLVLHLTGNVRQWIISGLGGAPDTRHRDQEFAEKGPLPKRLLLGRLRTTVKQAGRVISSRTLEDLTSLLHPIQGFRVTGLQAIIHVMEHFAFHTGQIIYLTKIKTQKDLGFTRLPEEKRTKARARRLAAL